MQISHYPKTNTEYWINKFKKNEENDEKNYLLLRNYGWHVIVVWECEIKEDIDKLISTIEEELRDYLLYDS